MPAKRSRGLMCCVRMCKNYQLDKDLNPSSVHFFKIPRDVLHDSWCDLIKSKEGTNVFKLSKTPVICHEHFMAKDITKAIGSTRWCLKPSAVPSIFPAVKKATSSSTKKRTKKRCKLPGKLLSTTTVVKNFISNMSKQQDNGISDGPSTAHTPATKIVEENGVIFICHGQATSKKFFKTLKTITVVSKEEDSIIDVESLTKDANRSEDNVIYTDLVEESEGVEDYRHEQRNVDKSTGGCSHSQQTLNYDVKQEIDMDTECEKDLRGTENIYHEPLVYDMSTANMSVSGSITPFPADQSICLYLYVTQTESRDTSDRKKLGLDGGLNKCEFKIRNTVENIDIGEVNCAYIQESGIVVFHEMFGTLLLNVFSCIACARVHVFLSKFSFNQDTNHCVPDCGFILRSHSVHSLIEFQNCNTCCSAVQFILQKCVIQKGHHGAVCRTLFDLFKVSSLEKNMHNKAMIKTVGFKSEKARAKSDLTIPILLPSKNAVRNSSKRKGVMKKKQTESKKKKTLVKEWVGSNDVHLLQQVKECKIVIPKIDRCLTRGLSCIICRRQNVETLSLNVVL